MFMIQIFQFTKTLRMFERSRKIRAENEALLRGDDSAYSAGTDLGWSPPTLADVEAERRRG